MASRARISGKLRRRNPLRELWGIAMQHLAVGSDSPKVYQSPRIVIPPRGRSSLRHGRKKPGAI